MQLTATEFASLIRDLRCDARPDERRGIPRAPTRTRLEVVSVIAGATPPLPQMIRVRDISRTGLGMIIADKVEPGHRYLVLLPKTATETFVLLCEVARVTRLPGDSYGIGVQLVRRVTEDERAAFMRGDPDVTAALLAREVPPAATPVPPPVPTVAPAAGSLATSPDPAADAPAPAVAA